MNECEAAMWPHWPIHATVMYMSFWFYYRPGFEKIITKNASFWGVVKELLFGSRSVNAHKQPGTGALIERTHVSLENRNCIFYQKSILKSNCFIHK